MALEGLEESDIEEILELLKGPSGVNLSSS